MSRPVSGSRKSRPASNARRPTRKASDARRPAPPSARSVALDVIRRVTDEGAYSNLTLARTLARAGLSERDAAFATELVYGTLRRLIPIDHTLAPLLERPIDTAPKGARAALRLGAYQLRYLRVPAHAAVSETVALVDQRHRGFVNAVLRRSATLEPGRSPRERATSRSRCGPGSPSGPCASSAGSWPRTRRRNAPPPPSPNERRSRSARTPAARRSTSSNASCASAGIQTERGTVHPDSLVVASGSPSALPGFAEGRFAVQDQASSFVVRALDPQPGDRVLDVCAGPGGKTGHLACLVEPMGRVVAADVSLARLELVRANIERLGLRAELLVQDGRRPAVREGFDRILVDAPCSGIGSARRRPELLWRARKDELAGLARLQVGIATAAAGLLRPGGRLVYSVCTFPRAETDAACDAIVRRAPELEPVEIAGPDGPAERIRLWPHRHGCDAMFVAAFRGRATARG